ncbi:diphthine synthase [Candidatus Pacearchaeota archaeon]|nr:diphthine synthase [Candidatus Pacearchaeota archaeon]
MFYLIGLGLSEKSLNLEAVEVCKNADAVYMENYTVKFPYDINKLEDLIGKKIIKLDRNQAEKAEFLENARKKNVALLVYGNPLTATTHISLLQYCVSKGISYKIIPNASVFDAIAETGLQLYKFGKTASIPAWNDKYKPDSFALVVKENLSIDAHTLLLVDIGLSCWNALNQLEEALRKNNILELGHIYICSRLGTDNQKIFVINLKDELYEKVLQVEEPFCFIIPAKMHFIEKEFTDNFSKV